MALSVCHTFGGIRPELLSTIGTSVTRVEHNSSYMTTNLLKINCILLCILAYDISVIIVLYLVKFLSFFLELFSTVFGELKIYIS